MNVIFQNKETQRNFFVLALVLFFLVFIFHSKSENSKSVVIIAGQKINVEVVDTYKSRALGLSGRAGLAEDEGMLFVFEKSGQYPFWMKDMNFAIDIIWIDENLHVVSIEKDAKPESYPNNFVPEIPAKYVLEVVSGFSDKNNLKIGDQSQFIFKQ
jgi:uncharacterized membrane protein (UPF0127 family)